MEEPMRYAKYRCDCGHPWGIHDVEEYPVDDSETCCVSGCDQVGCPGRSKTVDRPLTDLVGLDPNFTDGLSTEEYMRATGCGGYEQCKQAERDRDKWERRCADLGTAIAKLCAAAQPWRDYWIQWRGSYVSPEAEALLEAFKATDAELARIDATAGV